MVWTDRGVSGRRTLKPGNEETSKPSGPVPKPTTVNTTTGGYVPIKVKEQIEQKESTIPPGTVVSTTGPISVDTFSKLPPKEQDKIIFETYGTDKTTQVYRAYTGKIGLVPHPKLSYQGERMREFFRSRGILRENLTEEELRSSIRYMLYEDATEPVKAQEKVLAKMNPTERAITTAGKSFVQMGVGVLNFPEFAVEEIGGRAYHGITQGKWNKPITPPSWSPRGYYEKEVAPSVAGPSGAVGTAFSAATREFEKKTGAWTPEKELQYQSGLKIAQKYPETFIAGTFGELLGGKGASQTFTLGKSEVGKGTVAVIKKTTGKELVPKALTPTNIVTEATSRLRQKLGLEKEIKSEKYFTPETSTYGQIPFKKAVKEFESTKTTGLKPGEYTVSHTAPSPLTIIPRTVKIKGSTSESPALSTSPFGRAVPQFLKIDPDLPTSYRISPIPKISKPTSPTIFLKEIYRLPKEARTDLAKSAEIMKSQPKGKYGIIAPKMELGRLGKVEPEVLIWKGTKLTRTKEFTLPKDIIVERKVWKDLSRGKPQRLSTTYKGVRVPIPLYEIKGEGKPGAGFTKISGKLKGGFKRTVFESEGKKTEPYFRPTYFKPSYPSKRSIPSKPLYYRKKSKPYIRTDYSRSSYPSKPSYPSEPYKPEPSYPKYSVPSKPSYPKYSKPSYPSYAKRSYPSKPSYPSVPSYPSKPSKSSKLIYYDLGPKIEQPRIKQKNRIRLKKRYRERKFKLGETFGGRFK